MCCCMGRITITLNDRDHLALKLLGLQRNQKIAILLQDAMHRYLEQTGAYDLAIRSVKASDDINDNA